MPHKKIRGLVEHCRVIFFLKQFDRMKKMKTFDFTLYALPKVSLNEWYGGTHWSKRKDIKNAYHMVISNQKNQLREIEINKPCEVSYDFYFCGRTLDASNTAAMIKLIEDVIFEKKDDAKTIQKISVSSKKSEIGRDYVNISIIYT